MPKRRRPTTEAASRLLARHTGADALAVVSGAEPPTRSRGATTGTRYSVTTVRLTADQHEWVRLEAVRHAVRHGGKADASEVIRALIAEAMKRPR